MKTIKAADVDVMKGVYLDFENGRVVLIQLDTDNIMCVGLDDSYRGEERDLMTLLKQHNNIDVAKTFDGKKIVF